MKIKKDNKTEKKEFNYKVIEKCGVLGKRGSYTLELRYVSFNGNDPKYDIRTWGQDKEGNEKMGKGVQLSGEELEKLRSLLNE